MDPSAEALFADDTTLYGMREEMIEGKDRKDGMKNFKEHRNEREHSAGGQNAWNMDG